VAAPPREGAGQGRFAAQDRAGPRLARVAGGSCLARGLGEGVPPREGGPGEGAATAPGEPGGGVAEPPELFQLKCLSHASGAVTHLNRNNPSVPQI
jgi:hypothetical protein